MYSRNSFESKVSKFIFDHPNLVQRVRRIPNYNDEPQLYHFISQFIENDNLTTRELGSASGSSFEENRAYVKLLGETIERYALGVLNNRLVYKTYNELNAKKQVALNPNKFVPARFPGICAIDLSKYLTTKLHWVEGISLVTNQKIYVPAQLIFVPYLYQGSEPVIQTPISTGAAAGETIYDAIYRGICEVIERDSFMIHYYNYINSPKINLQDLEDKKISKIVRIFKRYNLEVCVNDITTDIGIPAVVSIVIDRTGMGPAVSVGLKAGFDINENVIGAIEEALMIRSWIRDDNIYLKPRRKDVKIIRSVEERADYWFPVNMIDYLDFWLNSKEELPPKLGVNRSLTYKKKVLYLINILNKNNCNIIYVDITPVDMKEYGVKVVRVIIPQLQPLHLDEKYPYLAFRRLYTAPVDMGVLEKPKTFKELNNIPHPFL